MKKIIFIFSLLSSVYSFGQCNEYYINELISGPTERFFGSGSPIRFCPKEKGVVLNGYIYDTYQWEGISTQYITLTKDGGIAGNLVLSLKEKTLLVSVFGSPGDQLYSLSFDQNEYQKWLDNKPFRDQEKAEKMKEEESRLKLQEEHKLEEELKAEKIKNLIDKHKLHDKFKEIDTSFVNSLLRDKDNKNSKFRNLLAFSPKDTIIITYDENGSISSNVNFIEMMNAYCEKLIEDKKYYESRTQIEKDAIKKKDSVNRLSNEHCLRTPNTYQENNFGIYSTYVYELFKSEIDKNDTVIEGYNIKLKSKIIINLSFIDTFEEKRIYAPLKFKERNLYYSKEQFNSMYNGSFTTEYVQDFKDINTVVDDPIDYLPCKDLIVTGAVYRRIYANNTLISKIYIEEKNQYYKFKKVKKNGS